MIRLGRFLKLQGSLAILVITLLSACASQPRVTSIPKELYGDSTPIPPKEFQVSTQPIIELRYIASVDENVFDLANEHYMVHKLLSAARKPNDFTHERKKVHNNLPLSSQRENAIEAFPDAIYKTHYAALEFYRLLQDSLGDRAAVVLSANRITSAKGEVLIEEIGCDCPPAALIIDFFAYTTPNWIPGGNAGWGTPPTTTAEFIMPVVSMATQRSLSPETDGLLVAPTGFVNFIDRNTQSPYEPASADIFQLMNKHMLWSDSSVYASYLSETGPIEPGKVLTYPDISLEFTELASETSLHSVLQPFAVATADALNRLIDAKSEALLLSNYARHYDAVLAELIAQNAPLTDNQRLRVQLLREFLGAEIAFFSARDQHYYESVMHGEWAKSVYALRAAEKDRNSKAATAMTVGMLASVIAVPTATPVYAITDLTMDTVGNLEESYKAAFSKFELDQFEYSVRVQRETRTIQASTPGGLRSQLYEIYREQFTQSH